MTTLPQVFVLHPSPELATCATVDFISEALASALCLQWYLRCLFNIVRSTQNFFPKSSCLRLNENKCLDTLKTLI